jgi:hypothetical protein
MLATRFDFYSIFRKIVSIVLVFLIDELKCFDKKCSKVNDKKSFLSK